MFSKFLLGTFVCFLVLVNTGCNTQTPLQSATDTVVFASDIVSIKTGYDVTRNLLIAKKDIFTSDEWEKLKNFDSIIKTLNDNFTNIYKGNIKNVDVLQIKNLVLLSRIAYKDAKSVITNHLSSFDTISQSQIASIQTAMDDINTNIDKVLNDSKVTDWIPTINNILLIVESSVKILSVAGVL